VQRVSFGPASWIGLIGAIAAATAPVFGNLPVTWGATVAAILAAITVIGRQAQAIINTIYDEPIIDELLLVDDLPAEATDVPVDTEA
jgi:hypothetical protein